MATKVKRGKTKSASSRGYPDLHEHLAALDEAGLLRTIDAPINKDTELQPLVRWQFRGGIPEKDRKAFLFTNVTNSAGRTYDLPVAVGALATNAAIYSIGMGVPVEEIESRWTHAIANPIAPIEVMEGQCQEVVIEGAALDGDGKGLDAIPVPISTPGYDSAPYFTATGVISRDPETGVQNMGTYRCGLKSPRRMGMMVFSPGLAGGFVHWQKHRMKGERMPCAVVLGAPPVIAYLGPQKLPRDVDELAVAGGIAGAPIRVVKAHSSDLMVPADAEIIIEGTIDPEYLEPEGPFGESHGYVALEDYNLAIDVTAITRRRDAILTSIISQVTPSESSVIKRIAYEPMFIGHLRDHLGIKGVKKVCLHEPLTNLRPVLFVQMERHVPTTEVWRALYGAASYQSMCGKYVIAVNEDIDPDNGDAVFWALAYRANPALDVQILDHRARLHGPRVERGADESTMLIDATLKADMPPLALPKREYMEKAQALWERLGLPPLKPEAPWHGYSLGDWTDEWDEMAKRAAEGRYLENGRRSAQFRRKDVMPNTAFRNSPKSDKPKV